MNLRDSRRSRSSVYIFIIVGWCFFLYLLGTWHKSGFGKGDGFAIQMIEKAADCNFVPNLIIKTIHGLNSSDIDTVHDQFQPCDHDTYTHYTPCQDQKRSMNYPKTDMIHRERHCPSQERRLKCLIPAPKGYMAPFLWPKSRDYVPYANAPLTVEKDIQNRIQYEGGNVFRFSGGGGMQFPQGVDAYIDQLASVIPINNGTVRTALDTGCGVGSLGAYLWKRNVITMSFANKDNQVQFALERGVPAVIGVLGSIKMPYPSKAFDMAHCSRCLIPWGSNDGKYMIEVDRVLRPGGYWVLSGTPINWKNNYKIWQRPKDDLEEEQRNIEEIARLLCWEKISENGETVIWQKKLDPKPCRATKDIIHGLEYCSQDPDDIWYKKMETCVTPTTFNSHEIKPFPQRLYAIPPRIMSGSIPGVSVDKYMEDNKIWKEHVKAYKRFNTIIGSGSYRNIMDMNAGLGGFAAELDSSKLWVMNVVPILEDTKNTLGVIYERGLIGIYHDWCEAFSTYPRTYDLIHANNLFSLYKNRSCDFEDILLEIDRILRPEGIVILRDDVGVLMKVKNIIGAMRWDAKLFDHEDGPLVSQKILVAVKQYWVVNGNNSIVRKPASLNFI